MQKQVIQLTVNGERHAVAVAPAWTLVDALRNALGLTGTKESCGTGDCGACTILANGEPICACLMLAVDAEELDLVTIEGLARDGQLDPLQATFVERGAVQCGFCTPGMILAARALLNENPRPSEAEVREALGGNLCRCTGYAKIVDAVLAAAAQAPAGGR